MNLKDVCIPGLLLITVSTFGQPPVITNVDKYSEGTGRKVTVAGSNFGTNPANVAVYFGAQKSTGTSITNQVVEAIVPPGATLDNITITNTVTGLTGFSAQQFSLNYGGVHPFLPANLTTPQEDFAGESGLYDLCLCDLDGDGKTDVAAANDKNAQTLVSLFRNTSTAAGDIDFVKTTISIGTRSLHVTCGDLNGDGKKDLVVSEGGSGERLFILRNTSTVGTLSFVSQSITLAGKLPKRVAINDLDMDGKPELIVTDQKSDNKNLLVLLNTSSLATISFGAAQSIAVPTVTADAKSSSDGLDVQDIDGDRLPEIIVNQFLTANSNVFIFKNTSTQGALRFLSVTTLPLAGTPVNVRVGDLNGDARPDIVATQLLAFGITTFVNESTATEIRFGAGVATETDERPWGIDLGDLDGDGKLDVVVASVTKKSITVLNNTSAGSAITFSPKQVVTTSFINRHIRIGDLDGDGKPDISFASVDDDNLGPAGAASRLSVLRNKSCITPTIHPSGPLIVCSGFPLALEASVSAGATYQWKKNGANIPTATAATFTPIDIEQAMYSVDITSDGCTKTSAGTDVTVIATGSVPAPAMSSSSPVCKGATLTLGASSAGATGYEWTGPAGFTASGTSVTRTNFEIGFAGRYQVNVMVGTCVAQQGSVIVEMITLPDFKVGFTGNDIICSGSSKALTVDPPDPNFTYQWFENTSGAISGATNTGHTISESGEYYFQAQSVLFPTCPAVSSQHSTFRKVAVPVAMFTSPASTCTNTVVTFTNQSTLDADAGANYLWDFGDASTSTETSPTHTYLATGNRTVTLTASYRGNMCPTQLAKPITVSVLPTANITSATSVFEFCPGNKLILGVDNTFTSYLWSTNETTPTIEVAAAGTYSVQVTNATGCKVTPSRVVTQLTAPAVEAAAERTVINIGESTQLQATPGLSTYLWTPAETLSNPAVANPIATPEERTTYMVTATASNGCQGIGQVEVDVTFDNIVNLLQPGNFISPNGDNINDTWEVGLISSFPQCGVKIFDEKGSKVYDALPYLNDWNATLNGKVLPNGVYFYFIQCGGESQSRTGSITVVH